MQKKKKHTNIIYRSINKYIIKDSLYSTWVFEYFGKVGKEESEVIKSFEFLLKCKMAPKNR